MRMMTVHGATTCGVGTGAARTRTRSPWCHVKGAVTVTLWGPVLF